MNEQQRQAVERLQSLTIRSFDELFVSRTDDVRTLLSLLDRPTTCSSCSSCSTELQGPFCPKCNAKVVEQLSAEEIAEWIRSWLHGRYLRDHFVDGDRLSLAQAILDRLSAPVQS